MKSFKRFFQPLAVVLAAGFSIEISAADAPPVRILPLGDSITLGCCSGAFTEGGYRTRLHSLLTGEGFNVDFVGTQKDDNNPALPDVDHEGHGGFHIADIRSGLPVWLKEDKDPDVILLHIGTNDFSTNSTVSATQNALKGLLADLATARPYAKIIVSSLIVRTDNPAIEALQQAYNQSLPGIVSEQVSLGREVYFLDMHSVLDPDDLNEGVHPKIAGYEKMADAWLPAISEVITPLGTANPPAIARVDARQDLTHVTVTFSKPVEDAAATVSNFTLSGGIGITGAELDAVSKRTVTLTTTTQSVGTLYNLTASGVRDRTPEQNEISPGAGRNFTSRTLLDGSFEANGTGWAKDGSSQVYDALPSTPATDGSKLMVFNGLDTPTGGEVSQTVVTIPGKKYKLGFDVGVFSSGSQSLQVSVEGNNSTVLSQTENVSGNSPDSTLWANRNYEFTANSLSTTVTFQDTSPSTQNADLLLDDVRLNQTITPILTVNSTPATGVSVTVSPNDLSANGNGTTNFTRTYNESTSVSLTAPATSGSKFFDRWLKDSANHSLTAATSVTMDADHTMTADYRILKNGSFEFGTPANVGTVTDWTTSGNFFTYTSDGTYNANDFTRFLVFNGGDSTPNGVISQTFTTTPGQTYQVSFDLGTYALNTNQQDIKVEITGITSPVSQTDSVARVFGDPSLKWVPKTATFVASGTSATITFTDVTTVGNGSSADLYLDNVKVLETFANTAPVAVNDSYSTSINVPLTVAAASGVLANDTDAQSNPLTAAVVVNPTHGTLSLGTNGGFTYTPTTGYTGSDSFTYKANDGSLDSNVATVSLTITSVASGTLTNGSFEQGSPANLGPATGWNFSANYPTSGAPLCYVPDGGYPATVADGVRLLIFNAGGDVFTGAVSQQFATTPGQTYSLNLNTGVFSNGTSGLIQKLGVTVTGTATLLSQVETLTSTSGTAALALKSYSFTADSATTTLILSDGSSAVGPSATGSDLLVDYVRVALASSNTAPVATNDTYSTNQNTALGVSIPGVLSNDTDAQSNSLTAIKVTDPGHGTVTLNSNGSFTYTPASGYTGPDSFTYKANDGSLDSNTATVSITVTTPPVTILANGSFESGAVVSGRVTALDNWSPQNSVIGFTGDSNDYYSTDGTRLAVFNGGGSGTDGIISQTFTTVVGQAYQLSLDVGIYAGGTPSLNQRLLVKVDGTSNLLTQQVGRGSTNISNVSQWAGETFTFVAGSSSTTLTLSDDGTGFASPGSDLLVDHVQITAIASSRVLSVTSSPATGFAVTVSPADFGGLGDGATNFSRTYANNTAVTLTAPALSGANAFQKWQKNGVDLTTSITANVTMDANYTLNAVYVVNNAPFANADSYTTNEDTPKVVAAPGVLANDSDPNNASITAVLNAGPSHGTLTLDSDGGFTYTPVANYNGSESFTYHAKNSTLDSPVATVSLTITAVNDLPAAVAQSVQTNEDTALPITLAGTDADTADVLTYVVGTASHGTITGTAPNITYTPALNYFGPDSFTFTVNDGSGPSDPATVTINVVSVEDIPVADAQSVSLTAATSKAIILTGSDGDGQTLTFAVAANPTHGTLSGTAPNLTYTPVQTYTGADSFTFTTSDGTNTSPPATVSITVNGVLKNGSFESVTGLIPDFWTTSGNFSVTTASASQTATNGTKFIAFNDGNRTPNGVFTQSFQTTAGQPYQVLFDLGAYGAASQQKIRVTLTGSSQLVTADHTATGPGSNNTAWVNNKLVNFIANSATTTLKFEDVSTTSFNVDLMLDNVRLNPQQTRTLTVASSPDPGINVTVSPSDINGSGNGVSGFTRVYFDGATVNLTAPAVIAATNFQKWQKNGTDLTTNVATSVTMNADYTLTAVYIPNAPPLATADSYSTNEDVALVVPAATGVLANDTDPESVALTAVLNVGPTHGTLALNATNGGFTYTPNANYFGSDFFTYHASDGVVSSAITTVALTVNSVNDAPVGVADSYSTNEDTPLVVPAATGLLANDTDVESDPLTAVVNVAPAHGSVTLNTNGSFTYTPVADFNGSDSFIYHSNDGAANSAITTVSITVNPINDAPVAVAQPVNATEDVPKSITLVGTDVDGNSLTYSVGTPSHGGLTGTAPNLTYTPVANYSGTDSFTFTVNDGTVASAPATVSITVAAVNDAPVATAQAVNVNEDGSAAITLAGTDVEGSPLTFTAGTASHGTLSGTAPNLTYTPAANYNGPDSFTFKANDGTVDSAFATVSITVIPVNDAPSAVAQAVNATEDVAKSITLSGTDVDGDNLTYSVGTVSHGTLTGTAPNLTYTPATNYNGPDSFSFTVSDGLLTSASADVSITVAAVNDAPAATAQPVNVSEDGSVSITLTGTDVENSPLTFTAGNPAHGSLSGTAPNLTYTPSANYNGPDSFTFTANDGTVDSAAATVSITVAPVNDAPVATAQLVNVNEDGTVGITLAGTDVDGNLLTFTAGSPSHGTLSGTAPNLTYTPVANYNGPDSFDFVANDGFVDSVPVTVSITVAPINDAPVAVAQSVNVNEDGSLSITLSGTDVETSPLTYTVGTPTHGSVSGTAPNLTYTPVVNYFGSDSFSFTVNDGTVDSASALVSITVAAVNDAPVASSDSYSTDEDTSLVIPAKGVLVNDS
ncbi:MAG: Ig-like domain-containing protein, partial [Luteolibacter sp.]